MQLGLLALELKVQAFLFWEIFRKWETAISNYQGSDPLEHWYQYICWYEQNIQMDHERLFETILGKCLSIYEGQQHYKQDTRMVKLWMKYVRKLNFFFSREYFFSNSLFEISI